MTKRLSAGFQEINYLKKTEKKRTRKSIKKEGKRKFYTTEPFF